MIVKDINDIRADFPVLGRKVYDKPLVYFDNGATTQKPQCVIDTISEVFTTYNSNIHRGVHFLSDKASEEYENAIALIDPVVPEVKIISSFFSALMKERTFSRAFSYSSEALSLRK